MIFEPQPGGEMPAQTDVPFMDQVQQTFTPPMLLVRTGQPTEFRNNDDVLHNVRVREDETQTAGVQRRDSHWREVRVFISARRVLRRRL